MPVIHMMYGFTGAGKTTFSRDLAEKRGIARLSNDEYLRTLHGPAPPAETFQALHDEAMIVLWQETEKILRRGQDVILDFGFWKRRDRDYCRDVVAPRHAAETKLYFITCDAKTMRDRVLRRTADLPDGALFIDENALALFKTRIEPLGTDETHIIINTD